MSNSQVESNEHPIVEALSRTLADYYVLMLKTHFYHWNVEGPNFRSLHKMFEEQYTDLFEAIDNVAERIRALGGIAPGSFESFKGIAQVKESAGAPPASRTMLQNLLEDHQAVTTSLKKLAEDADEAGDQTTSDLAAERIGVHQEQIWMMRATLAE